MVTNVKKSSVTTITNNDTDLNVSIYPNPTLEKIIIGTQKTNIEWELFTLSGIELQSGTSLQIDMTNYIEGVYVLKIGEVAYRVIKAQ